MSQLFDSPPARASQCRDELRTADDPEDFAKLVCDLLLDDPQVATALAKRGRERVAGHFGWEAVAERISRICLDAVQIVSEGTLAPSPSANQDE